MSIVIYGSKECFNIKEPTSGSYNSLIFHKPEQTTFHCFPLFPGSPTERSNLYTALKFVQGINAKCIQSRQKSEIAENVVFRLGELRIVFAMLI